jgi:hypothetical protein
MPAIGQPGDLIAAILLLDARGTLVAITVGPSRPRLFGFCFRGHAFLTMPHVERFLQINLARRLTGARSANGARNLFIWPGRSASS